MSSEIVNERNFLVGSENSYIFLSFQCVTRMAATRIPLGHPEPPRRPLSHTHNCPSHRTALTLTLTLLLRPVSYPFCPPVLTYQPGDKTTAGHSQPLLLLMHLKPSRVPGAECPPASISMAYLHRSVSPGSPLNPRLLRGVPQAKDHKTAPSQTVPMLLCPVTRQTLEMLRSSQL